MGTVFGFDSPFMKFMRKVVNFMLLNFLTVLCSLPILTAGAAISATHYVCVKMQEGDISISVAYIDAFKTNFKRGTLIWLILLGLIAFGVFDYEFAKSLTSNMQGIVHTVLVVEGVVLLLASSWVFPLQARYENKILHTIKNAAILTIAYLPSTILMSIMGILPVVMLLVSEYTLPLVLLFGAVLPIYWNTRVYCKILDRIDNNAAQEGEQEYDISE